MRDALIRAQHTRISGMVSLPGRVQGTRRKVGCGVHAEANTGRINLGMRRPRKRPERGEENCHIELAVKVRHPCSFPSLHFHSLKGRFLCGIPEVADLVEPG